MRAFLYTEAPEKPIDSTPANEELVKQSMTRVRIPASLSKDDAECYFEGPHVSLRQIAQAPQRAVDGMGGPQSAAVTVGVPFVGTALVMLAGFQLWAIAAYWFVIFGIATWRALWDGRAGAEETDEQVTLTD